MRIHETLGEDSQGFARLWGEDLQGFMRLWERICIRKNLGEDSQGFMRLWERICKDSRDFGRGFTRIREFTRLWERI